MSELPYITCRELIEFLADYLEQALSPDQRREVDRHLALCPPCVAYIATYQKTIQLSKQALIAPDAPALDVVPEDLARAILARRQRAP